MELSEGFQDKNLHLRAANIIFQSMGMSDVIWKGSIKKEEKRAYDQTLRTLTLRSGKGISKGN